MSAELLACHKAFGHTLTMERYTDTSVRVSCSCGRKGGTAPTEDEAARLWAQMNTRSPSAQPSECPHDPMENAASVTGWACIHCLKIMPRPQSQPTGKPIQRELVEKLIEAIAEAPFPEIAVRHTLGRLLTQRDEAVALAKAAKNALYPFAVCHEPHEAYMKGRTISSSDVEEAHRVYHSTAPEALKFLRTEAVMAALKEDLWGREPSAEEWVKVGGSLDKWAAAIVAKLEKGE